MQYRPLTCDRLNINTNMFKGHGLILVEEGSMRWAGEEFGFSMMRSPCMKALSVLHRRHVHYHALAHANRVFKPQVFSFCSAPLFGGRLVLCYGAHGNPNLARRREMHLCMDPACQGKERKEKST